MVTAGQLGQVLSGVGAAATAPAGSGLGGAPFGGVLQNILKQTDTLDKKAQDAVTGLLSGQGVEVHDVMIAAQKSDMAFELALQVRNKAVGAYQQMMAMQF